MSLNRSEKLQNLTELIFILNLNTFRYDLFMRKSNTKISLPIVVNIKENNNMYLFIKSF